MQHVIYLTFIKSFGKNLKLRDYVNIWVVEDRIEYLDSVTFNNFKIYFYNNLFNPVQNSKIQNKTKLNKKITETLINQLFVLDDQEQSKVAINEYANDHEITITWLTCARANNYLFIRYCCLWTSKKMTVIKKTNFLGSLNKDF